MLKQLLIKSMCETEENVKLYPKFIFSNPELAFFFHNYYGLMIKVENMWIKKKRKVEQAKRM